MNRVASVSTASSSVYLQTDFKQTDMIVMKWLEHSFAGAIVWIRLCCVTVYNGILCKVSFLGQGHDGRPILNNWTRPLHRSSELKEPTI